MYESTYFVCFYPFNDFRTFARQGATPPPAHPMQGEPTNPTLYLTPPPTPQPQYTELPIKQYIKPLDTSTTPTTVSTTSPESVRYDTTGDNVVQPTQNIRPSPPPKPPSSEGTKDPIEPEIASKSIKNIVPKYLTDEANSDFKTTTKPETLTVKKAVTSESYRKPGPPEKTGPIQPSSIKYSTPITLTPLTKTPKILNVKDTSEDGPNTGVDSKNDLELATKPPLINKETYETPQPEQNPFYRRYTEGN